MNKSAENKSAEKKGKKKYAGNKRGSSDYWEQKLWLHVGTPDQRLDIKRLWANQKWTSHKNERGYT